MKACPLCAEDIQDAAIKCRHCGASLDTSATMAAAKTAALLQRHRAEADAVQRKRAGTSLGFLGACLLLGGLLALGYYLLIFDPSLPVPVRELFGRTIGGGRVNNLGLLQDRQNGLMLGAVAAVVGLGVLLWNEYTQKTAATVP